MAHSEACELYIEQQIKEGLDDGQTPYYIGKSLAEWLETLFEAKINPETLRSRARKIQKEQNDTGNITTTPNQLKKHTKPEVKIQLDTIVEAFKQNEITDDDAKKVIDIAADKVKNGTFSKRVGTKMATAVKKVNKERKEVTVRETDNYQRLWKCIRDAANGLQILADGSMPQPENEEETEAFKGLMMALPNLCLQTARMGVDLMEIHESLNKGESINEKKYIDV